MIKYQHLSLCLASFTRPFNRSIFFSQIKIESSWIKHRNKWRYSSKRHIINRVTKTYLILIARHKYTGITKAINLDRNNIVSNIISDIYAIGRESFIRINIIDVIFSINPSISQRVIDARVLYHNLSHIDVKCKFAWFHAFLICIFRKRIVNAERFYSHTQTLPRTKDTFIFAFNTQTH